MICALRGSWSPLEIVSKIKGGIFFPGDKDKAFFKHSKASMTPK